MAQRQPDGLAAVADGRPRPRPVRKPLPSAPLAPLQPGTPPAMPPALPTTPPTGASAEPLQPRSVSGKYGVFRLGVGNGAQAPAVPPPNTQHFRAPPSRPSTSAPPLPPPRPTEPQSPVDLAQVDAVVVGLLRRQGFPQDKLEAVLAKMTPAAKIALCRQYQSRMDRGGATGTPSVAPSSSTGSDRAEPTLDIASAQTPEYFVQTLTAFLKAEHKRNKMSNIKAVLSTFSSSHGGSSPLTPLLVRLAAVIQNKRTHDINKVWASRFVNDGGVQLLAEALRRLHSSSASGERVDWECEHALVVCFKALGDRLNLKQESAPPALLHAMASVLDASPSYAARIKAAEVLATACRAVPPQGHVAVLGALESHFGASLLASVDSREAPSNGHSRAETDLVSLTDRKAETASICTNGSSSVRSRTTGTAFSTADGPSKARLRVFEFLVRAIRDGANSRGILGSSVQAGGGTLSRRGAPSGTPGEVKEYMLAALTLVNTLLNTPRDVETRVQLRMLAIRAGLLDVFAQIGTFARDEFTHVHSQMEAFRFYDLHDRDLLRDGFRRKAELGQYEDASENVAALARWLDAEGDTTTRQHLNEMALLMVLAARGDARRRQHVFAILNYLVQQVVLDEKNATSSGLEAAFGLSLNDFLTNYVEKDLYDALQAQLDAQTAQAEAAKRDAERTLEERQAALKATFDAQQLKLESELESYRRQCTVMQTDLTRLEDAVVSTDAEMQQSRSSLASRIAEMEGGLLASNQAAAAVEAQRDALLRQVASLKQILAGRGLEAAAVDSAVSLTESLGALATTDSTTKGENGDRVAGIDSTDSQVCSGEGDSPGGEQAADGAQLETDGLSTGIPQPPPPPPPPPPPGTAGGIPPPPPPPPPGLDMGIAAVARLPPVELKYAPTADVSFKPLLLDKLPESAIRNSIWEKVLADESEAHEAIPTSESDMHEQTEPDATGPTETDFRQLEQLFGNSEKQNGTATPQDALSPKKSARENGSGAEELLFLDARRAQNIAISSKSLMARVSMDQLYAALRRDPLETAPALDEGDVRTLRECAPTEEDRAAVVGLDQAKLLPPERLVADLCAIDHLGNRLDALELETTYNDLLADWTQQARCVLRTLQALQSSAPLQRTLAVALQLANFVQQGNRRTLLHGFRASTLARLDGFRAPKDGRPLTEFLVDVLDQRMPGTVAALLGDLEPTAAAARVDVAHLERETAAFGGRLQKTIKIVAKRQKEAASDHFWAAAHEELTQGAVPLQGELAGLVAKIRDLRDVVPRYFGETGAADAEFSLSQFIGHFAAFSASMERARRAIKKREADRVLQERRERTRQEFEEKKSRAKAEAAAASKETGLSLGSASASLEDLVQQLRHTASSASLSSTPSSSPGRVVGEPLQSGAKLGVGIVREAAVDSASAQPTPTVQTPLGRGRIARIHGSHSESTLNNDAPPASPSPAPALGKTPRKPSWEALESRTLDMLQRLTGASSTSPVATPKPGLQARRDPTTSVSVSTELDATDEQYILSALIDFGANEPLSLDFGSFGL